MNERRAPRILKQGMIGQLVWKGSFVPVPEASGSKLEALECQASCETKFRQELSVAGEEVKGVEKAGLSGVRRPEDSHQVGIACSGNSKRVAKAKL